MFVTDWIGQHTSFDFIWSQPFIGQWRWILFLIGGWNGQEVETGQCNNCYNDPPPKTPTQPKQTLLLKKKLWILIAYLTVKRFIYDFYTVLNIYINDAITLPFGIYNLNSNGAGLLNVAWVRGGTMCPHLLDHPKTPPIIFGFSNELGKFKKFWTSRPLFSWRNSPPATLGLNLNFGHMYLVKFQILRKCRVGPKAIQ